jgi:hypothetical protein
MRIDSGGQTTGDASTHRPDMRRGMRHHSLTAAVVRNPAPQLISDEHDNDSTDNLVGDCGEHDANGHNADNTDQHDINLSTDDVDDRVAGQHHSSIDHCNLAGAHSNQHSCANNNKYSRTNDDNIVVGQQQSIQLVIDELDPKPESLRHKEHRDESRDTGNDAQRPHLKWQQDCNCTLQYLTFRQWQLKQQQA